MTSPAAYRPAKSVATADEVATDEAWVWFPAAQLEMKAAAAAAAVGLNAGGRTTVVFVPPAEAARTVVDVEVDGVVVWLDGGPWPSRCVTATVRALAVIAANTTMKAYLVGRDIGGLSGRTGSTGRVTRTGSGRRGEEPALPLGSGCSRTAKTANGGDGGSGARAASLGWKRTSPVGGRSYDLTLPSRTSSVGLPSSEKNLYS